LTGNASAYLPAINFILLIYSQQIAEHIEESGFQLTAKSDYDFMKNVFTMLSKLFDYHPQFKFDEFFAPSQAVDRKVTFILHLIQLVKQK